MIDTEQLYQKIGTLPDDLLPQVVDYVDFLIFKNNLNDNELSKEVKTELDQRYQNYLENPDSAIPLKVVKDKLMQKYGKV